MGIRDFLRTILAAGSNEEADNSAKDTRARARGESEGVPGRCDEESEADLSGAEIYELVCRTRGGSNPQGKPRVFVACHPQDYALYLEQIVAMMHEYVNCAVYYEDQSKGRGVMPWESLKTYVSEVQLIVVPVTTKLLKGNNRAMDQVIPFAEEKHIPVLPLMMESGLDELYGEKFGTVQYLEPGNDDRTALPFEQKLEKYLRGVLVGDELAQKVRNAFAAYIFLSYRKKDRAYAQELMRMIHRDKRYRDVAIWYDEYLVPGERFNESIREALEKGWFFTLVVTPNLLEKDNYIMQEEYPAAQKAQKRILPIQMKETDIDELKKHYDEIPEVVNARDPEALEKAFMQYFDFKEFMGQGGTAWHDFLIGLAYLEGIYVEVDFEKAVELITGAANDNLISAVEKLAAMYHDGKGVARDYRESVRWLERVVKIWRSEWEKSRCAEDLDGLERALLNLGEALYDMRDLEAARKAYKEMLSLAEEGTGPAGAFYLSVSSFALGTIEELQGNHDGAGELFKKAYEISSQMSVESEFPQFRQSLYLICERLGFLEIRRENYSEAGKWLEKAFEIAKQFVAENDSVDSRGKLAACYEHLGNNLTAQGRIAEAEEMHKRSLEIREKLSEELKTVSARRALSISFANLGRLERTKGHPDEAAKLLEKALNIRKKLAEETGSVESRRDLAEIYNTLGSAAIDRKNLREAKKWFEAEYEIAEKLLAETDSQDIRVIIAFVCDGLGKVEFAQRNIRKAKKWFEQSFDQSRMMYEKQKTVETRHMYSTGCMQLGDVEQSLGNFVRAKKLYEEGIEIREQLVEQTKAPEEFDNLAMSYCKIATLGGRLDRGYAMKAYSIYKDLADRYPEVPAYAGKRETLKKALD